MAIERFLEIVCEAAHKLPQEIKQAAPDIDWRAMKDLPTYCGMLITRRTSTLSGTLFNITCRR